MHYILKGVLFYISIVLIQLFIFFVVSGFVTLVEWVWAYLKRRERERRIQRRQNYLMDNTEKTFDIDKNEMVDKNTDLNTKDASPTIVSPKDVTIEIEELAQEEKPVKTIICEEIGEI